MEAGVRDHLLFLILCDVERCENVGVICSDFDGLPFVAPLTHGISEVRVLFVLLCLNFSFVTESYGCE